jgi:outer membrane protein assembly factor BamB
MRWEFDARGGFAGAIAGCDAKTGTAEWTVHQTPALPRFIPLADPAYEEGRVYFAALGVTGQAVHPLFLVCLSAESGRLVWERHVGSCVAPAGRIGGRGLQGPQSLGIVAFGNPVTVYGGAVYLAPDTGFVARCDARDGTLEWARSYEKDGDWGRRPARVPEEVLHRRGSRPAVVDAAVLAAPRDSAALLCLDRDSGALRWRHTGVPLDEIVGVYRKRVILRGAQSLVAVQVTSGKAVWEQAFEVPVRGRPVLAGAVVYAGTESELLAIDAVTGLVLASRAWPETGPFDDFVVRGGAIVGTTWH